MPRLSVLINRLPSPTLASTLFFTTYVASSIIARLRVQNEELIQSNLACELRTEELLEANLACELRSQELATLNTRLRELDAARMQFTLLVTHELRAPVAAIQSYLKLILDGYVPPERQREILERSERRAREQLDLIADINRKLTNGVSLLRGGAGNDAVSAPVSYPGRQPVVQATLLEMDGPRPVL